MENASDALIMAGEMLIFIVALTVCISSFTKVRVEIDKIVGQKETVQMAKNEENQEYVNYIKSKKNNSIRVVRAETLLPSMYRAIKENYVIYKLISNVYVFYFFVFVPIAIIIYKHIRNLIREDEEEDEDNK